MKPTALKIGIIGAGFSGVALAGALDRLADRPLALYLFEKTARFAAGDAYGTPFPFHLLNVRAHDMSAFQDVPDDFVNWLKNNQNYDQYLDHGVSIAEQFAPRCLYGQYLQDILGRIQTHKKHSLTLVPQEVVGIQASHENALLTLANHQSISVDKVVLAMGNNPPTDFPFPVSGVKTIANSWQYQALAEIPSSAPVLIVGTGLSMIDAVLTLYHHQHQGAIFALSRHGLLPLPHSDIKAPFQFENAFPVPLRQRTKYFRAMGKHQMAQGRQWQSMMNALRFQMPALWKSSQLQEKKRFVRHLLPYWNIHRHRVHAKLADLLLNLMNQQQLQILSGRILSVVDGKANIRLRHSSDTVQIKVEYLVNCMGPGIGLSKQQPLVQALIDSQLAMFDELQMGFAIGAQGAIKNPIGHLSETIFALGSLRKGTVWECTAVPEIRQQCFELAQHLLQ